MDHGQPQARFLEHRQREIATDARATRPKAVGVTKRARIAATTSETIWLPPKLKASQAEPRTSLRCEPSDTDDAGDQALLDEEAQKCGLAAPICKVADPQRRGRIDHETNANR